MVNHSTKRRQTNARSSFHSPGPFRWRTISSLAVKIDYYGIFAQECDKERYFPADYLPTAKSSTAVLVGNRIVAIQA